MESRWLRWVGPGVIALGAAGTLAAVTQGAPQRPWTPRSCDGGAAALAGAVRTPDPTTLPDLAVEPWFRMDPILDAQGALKGQRVALGLDGAPSIRTIELAAESFVAGPFGGVVLVGSDDGSTSRLQAIDVAAACSWAVAEESAVVRRATIDPAAALVYEVRVDRESRADLGTWSRPLDGLGAARAVLPPIASDDRFGRTFSTEFVWSADGQQLAVQSCGEVACRTRIIGANGRPDRELGEPDLGILLGFDGDVVVTYGACRGLPCPIVATDVASGGVKVLASESGMAVVAETSQGPRLVHEVMDGADIRLRSVAFDGDSAADLGAMPGGLRLHPAADRSGAATNLPDDWILLAPDGRLPIDASSARPQLRHLPDGATVQLDEVVR